MLLRALQRAEGRVSSRPEVLLPPAGGLGALARLSPPVPGAEYRAPAKKAATAATAAAAARRKAGAPPPPPAQQLAAGAPGASAEEAVEEQQDAAALEELDPVTLGQALLTQGAALTSAVNELGQHKKKKKKTRDVIYLQDSSAESTDSEAEGKLRLAKGFAAIQDLHGFRRKYPRQTTALILKTAANEIGVGRPEFKFRRFVKEAIAAKDHRTFGLMAWLVSGPLDLLVAGDTDGGTADLALLLAALHQCIIDEGKWANSWPLTGAPDLPWSYMDRKESSAVGDEKCFSPMIPREWVSAISSYRKDLRTLNEKTGPTPKLDAEGNPIPPRGKKPKKK